MKDVKVNALVMCIDDIHTELTSGQIYTVTTAGKVYIKVDNIDRWEAKECFRLVEI